MQTSVTHVNKTGKHLLTMGVLTLVMGFLAATVLPGYVGSGGLTLATAFAIFLGAMLGALTISRKMTENWIIDSLLAATVTTIVTSILYGAFGIAFDAVIMFVFVGSLLAAIVSKRLHK